MASSTSITVAAPLPTSTTHGGDYLLLIINTNKHVFLGDLICEKENGGLQAGRWVMEALCQMYPLVMNVILISLTDMEGLVQRHRQALITLTPSMLQRFLAGFKRQFPQANHI